MTNQDINQLFALLLPIIKNPKVLTANVISRADQFPVISLNVYDNETGQSIADYLFKYGGAINYENHFGEITIYGPTWKVVCAD